MFILYREKSEMEIAGEVNVLTPRRRKEVHFNNKPYLRTAVDVVWQREKNASNVDVNFA